MEYTQPATMADVEASPAEGSNNNGSSGGNTHTSSSADDDGGEDPLSTTDDPTNGTDDSGEPTSDVGSADKSNHPTEEDGAIAQRPSNGPSDAAGDARSVRQHIFEGLMARAGALPARDHDGARELLKEAYRNQLPNGETALLQQEIVMSTGLHGAVIKGLTTDAANHIPDHGYVPDVEETVRAMIAELDRRFGGIKHVEGKFFVYSDSTSADTTDAETNYWRALPNDKMEAMLFRAFPRVPVVQKSSNRKDVIKRLALHYHGDPAFFREARPGLCCLNGFLCVDPITHQGVLLPHSKEHRATYRLLFCYDPTATAPKFVDGLLKMVGEDQLKAACILQLMYAVMFRHRPSRDRNRTVMLLYGPSGSGKSTLTELIRRFLPKHVQASIPPDLWSDGYHLANLQGVLLNTVTELEPTAKAIKGAKFKLVASHEQVTARPIRQDPVTFVPQAFHLFSCNQLPTFGEGDPSLEKRIFALAVHAVAGSEGVNPHFLEDVWAEAPGIMNLLLQEALPMLESGKFTLPADNQKLVVQMQFPAQPEEHVARLWLEPAPGERVWSTDLQKAIRIAAETLGIDTGKWQSSANMKALSIRISKLYGATRHMLSGNVFYRGVRFTEEYAALLGDPEGAGDVDLGSALADNDPDADI